LGQNCTPLTASWTDDITEWTGMKINEVATAAEDRDHWRGILCAANTSYGGRHWTTMNGQLHEHQLKPTLVSGFNWRF